MTPQAGSAAWECGVARVLHEGRPVGVAFLIPDRLLLTCAHVVAATAGLSDAAALPDRLPVTLDFPLLPGRPMAEATVHFSVPVAGDNSGDVAVLRLSEEPPPGAAPLRIVEADDLAGHRWRAFGFPRYPGRGGTKDAGIWTRGVVEGREGTGWWQLTCDENAPFPLAGGFSGAPVWDDDYGGVIGLVVAVEGDQRRRTGYALTVESLTREWPQLRRRLLADSPYRELLPFTEADRDVFHGRLNETQQLFEILDQQVPVLPVFGPSGVGKSSLIGAGLLGRLDPERFVIARLPQGLRLGAEESLAWALASADDEDPMQAGWHERWSALARQLSDEQGVRTAVEQVLARRGGSRRLLLVVDQFETLLTDAPDTARRLDTLLGVLTARRPDGSRPAQAVVVTRIDFLRQFEQLPHLRAAWDATSIVVQPMTRARMRDVITRPLEGHAGIRFAGGLVEQLLRDTPPGPAALPMLEYALSRLWERQERGVLTTEVYQEIGGVEGALAEDAEKSLWGWADASERLALERIFIQLVHPGERLDAGERGPDTRRIAARDQFSERDWALIHRLASTRLIVVTRRPSGQDTAELAHQALLERWDRLRGWVEANREFRTWQEGVRRSLRLWQERERPRALVLDREQVAASQQWIARRGDEVPIEEREFVEVSDGVQRRVRRVRRWALAAFAALTAIILVAVGLATQNARSAGEQRSLAAARGLVEQSRLYASGDPALAARLALAAHRVSPSPDTRAQLLNRVLDAQQATLTGHKSGVMSVSFSPDGRTLASGGRDGTARLWDTRRHRLDTTIDARSSQVGNVVISPDGMTLLMSRVKWRTGLWDVRTRRQAAVLDGAGGPATFSPDGDTIATGSENGRVILWDAHTHMRTHELRVHPADKGVLISELAFSPDGRTLAVAVDGYGTSKSDKQAVQLWDVGERRHTATLMGHTGWVQSLAFSPDSGTLASGASDSRVFLWNVRTHERLATLSGHTNTVFSLAFSPDGRVLASGSYDRSILLWDVRQRRSVTLLTGHTGSVDALAFSADGSMLASGASDADVRLWDMKLVRPRAVLAGPRTLGAPADYRPDGKVLATGGSDGAVWLTDTRTWRTVGRLTGHKGQLNAVRFSPDGRYVAATSDDNPHVLLWDAHTSRLLHTFKWSRGYGQQVRFSPDGKTFAATNYVAASTSLWSLRTYRKLADIRSHTSLLAFSPEGDVLVTGGQEWSSVQLWDAHTRRRLGSLEGLRSMSAEVAFSPDGETLTTAGLDGKLRFWDTHRRRLEATVDAHAERVNSVKYTSDGKTVATSSDDSLVKLWDARTHRRVATLNGHTDHVTELVISTDGRTVATAGNDSTVRLWDVATHRQLGVLTGNTGNSVSPLFSPRGTSLVTTSVDQVIRIWDTSALKGDDGLTRRACALAGRSLSESEWRRYVPRGVAYRRVCP